MSVRRFDLGQFRKAEITPQGYLKADAYATRVGVFKYVLPDGTVRRELRPHEEVFKTDSLKTLSEVAVTNDHPPEMLTSDNTKKFAVGFTGEKVDADSEFVKVGITITDKHAVQDVKDHGKVQTSCGYYCDLDETPGVFQGEKYDAVQRNIKYNHLAIVDRGRAGPESRIRLDAKDAIMSDPKNDKDWDVAYVNDLPDSAFAYIESGGDKDEDGKTVPRSKRHFPYKNAAGEIDLPHLRNALARAPQSPFGDEAMKKLRAAAKEAQVGEFAEGKKDTIQKGNHMTAKIKVDSVEYEAGEGLAKVVADKIEKLDSATKEVENLKGRCDALQAELKKKDEEIEALKKAAPTSADLMKLARGRLDLEDFAKKILGKDEKFDDASDLEIKKRVIIKKLPDTKLDGKSDDYVNGRFDVLRETHSEKNSGADKVKDTLSTHARGDGEKLDAQSAREKHMAASVAAWQQPLSPEKKTA